MKGRHRGDAGDRQPAPDGSRFDSDRLLSPLRRVRGWRGVPHRLSATRWDRDARRNEAEDRRRRPGRRRSAPTGRFRRSCRRLPRRCGVERGSRSTSRPTSATATWFSGASTSKDAVRPRWPRHRPARSRTRALPTDKWVRAGHAATLSFAGATLEIPAGAVTEDTRITVRPLGDVRSPPPTTR